MKKIVFSIVIFAIVLSSVFADDASYGIKTEVNFNFYTNGEIDRTASFTFYPYVNTEVLKFTLRATWSPDENGANGFDYLFSFDSSTWYKTVDSVLNYFDEFGIDIKLMKINFTRDVDSSSLKDYLSDMDYSISVGFDLGFMNFGIETTDFHKSSDENVYSNVEKGYFNFVLGKIEVGADLIRQFSFEEPNLFNFESNIFTPVVHVGYKSKSGLNLTLKALTKVQMTDEGHLPGSFLDNWAIELDAKQDAGFISVSETIFANNGIANFKDINNTELLFCYSTDLTFNFTKTTNLKLSAFVPFSFENGFHIVKDVYTEKTSDRFGLSVQIGLFKSLQISAGVKITHLISDIGDRVGFQDLLLAGNPWAKVSFGNKKALDAYFKVELNALDPFDASYTVGVKLNTENFL